jgi:hypothetical protein
MNRLESSMQRVDMAFILSGASDLLLSIANFVESKLKEIKETTKDASSISEEDYLVTI